MLWIGRPNGSPPHPEHFLPFSKGGENEKILCGLLMLTGALTVSQAGAIFVFNPTLTMHGARHVSASSPAKAALPVAKDQGAGYKPGRSGTRTADAEVRTFPKLGMNK